MFERYLLCFILTFIGSFTVAETVAETVVTASSSDSNICWKKEYNPAINKKYKSKKIYDTDLKNWESKRPSEPGLFDLAKAYSLFQGEKQNADKLLRDKIKHCYFGCRIAHETNYKTADYVAWLKEYKDLTDCELSSRFEPRDYTATLDGAKNPGSNFEECSRYCKDSWKKRKRK